MRDIGFFYIVNHGYSQHQVGLVSPQLLIASLISNQNDRIFDIADVTFSQVTDHEKRRFEGDIQNTGTYEGYKLQNYWVMIDAFGRSLIFNIPSLR